MLSVVRQIQHPSISQIRIPHLLLAVGADVVAVCPASNLLCLPLAILPPISEPYIWNPAMPLGNPLYSTFIIQRSTRFTSIGANTKNYKKQG